MNWEALGAIAESLGALGVILTLLYLGRQIRGQNIESRLTAFNTMTQQWATLIGDLAVRNDLADVFYKGASNFESLDGVETVRFSSHLGRTFRVIEGIYTQHSAGRLDNETWTAVVNSMRDLCSLPGVKAWWPTRSHWFSLQYQSFIQPMIDDHGEQHMYKRLR